MHFAENVHFDMISRKRSGERAHLLTMIYHFLDNCLKVFAVILLAEFIRRMYLVVREFYFYKNHYEAEDCLWTIIRRSFVVNTETKIILMIYAAAFLVRFAMTKDFILPPISWNAFMVLYWLWIACNVNHSGLSNAEWIRKPYGIDYASGMASNYFHGYLKLTLPSHKGHLGIKERMDLYESQQNVTFALKRLVILIPNTMFVSAQFTSSLLTKEGVAPLEVIYKKRAGVERPFKNDIYRFTTPINGVIYYVAMEGATPMLSFFEAMNFQQTTTQEIKEMKREILLKFYKHLNKMLKEWPETEDEAELIFYNAYKADKSPQDVGEVLLSHLTNMWKEGRK